MFYVMQMPRSFLCPVLITCACGAILCSQASAEKEEPEEDDDEVSSFSVIIALLTIHELMRHLWIRSVVMVKDLMCTPLADVYRMSLRSLRMEMTLRHPRRRHLRRR